MLRITPGKTFNFLRCTIKNSTCYHFVYFKQDAHGMYGGKREIVLNLSIREDRVNRTRSMDTLLLVRVGQLTY